MCPTTRKATSEYSIGESHSSTTLERPANAIATMRLRMLLFGKPTDVDSSYRITLM